jgi:hypothetical protein
MSTMRRVMPIVAALSVGACGLYVPGIQEIPGDSEGGQRFVQAIVTNITCEAQNAFYDLYKDYKKTFMDGWGVQITLKLTIDEKGAANPTANWAPPSPITTVFSVAGGATLSADASRVDTLNSYYLVSDLVTHRCPDAIRGGPFMLESDLKLKEWLYDMVVAHGSGDVQFGKDVVSGPFKENVISHEVKFDVLSSGNITPTWKLTRVQFNPTGSFLSLSRERTHDLTITVGPADGTYLIGANGKPLLDAKGKPKIVNLGPSQQAADVHLSNLIGSAVGQAVGSALRP